MSDLKDEKFPQKIPDENVDYQIVKICGIEINIYPVVIKSYTDGSTAGYSYYEKEKSWIKNYECGAKKEKKLNV